MLHSVEGWPSKLPLKKGTSLWWVMYQLENGLTLHYVTCTMIWEYWSVIKLLTFHWRKDFLTTWEYSVLPQISIVTFNEWLCICTICKTGVVSFREYHEKAIIGTDFFENKSRSHVQLAAWWYIFCLWRALLRYPSFMTFWESGWKCLMEIVWKFILLKLGFAFLGNGVCLQALH